MARDTTKSRGGRGRRRTWRDEVRVQRIIGEAKTEDREERMQKAWQVREAAQKERRRRRRMKKAASAARRKAMKMEREGDMYFAPREGKVKMGLLYRLSMWFKNGKKDHEGGLIPGTNEWADNMLAIEDECRNSDNG